MYVAQWLDAHARIRPDHVAIVDRASGRRITYAQLRRSANQQAATLRRLGIAAGDRVAIHSANRVEMLELLFACARIGAVMVPLNHRLSAGELETVLADCGPSLLLEEPGRALDISVPCTRLPLVSAAADAPALDERLSVDPNAPLLILYTGGTTGVPKGAILTQATMQWNAWNTIAGWGLRPTDVAPAFTPFFHTGGLNVLATPLFCLGGTVVLPEGASFEPDTALRVIEEEGCTWVFMVPTMFTMLIRDPRFDARRMASVRALMSGGAPCPQSLFEAYWALGLPLRQGYGLTEAGPNTFGADLEAVRARPGTVGAPLPHVEVRLVRADGTECDADEVGELTVRGGHVMPGYFGRPRESAEALRDGWLHTGDLARRDADGYFYISGRRKEMFISGGENVFPAEIEEALLTHADVAEAAVVGVTDATWGEVGRAFVVVRAGAAPGAEALKAWCREKLAHYKVPKAFCFVEALPRSAAGKVLKAQLVAPLEVTR